MEELDYENVNEITEQEHDKMDTIERSTGVLERLLNIAENSKFTKLMKAFGIYFLMLLGIGITIIGGRFIIDPVGHIEKVVSVYDAKVAKDHRDAVDKRLEIEPSIRLNIMDARVNCNADRAFLFEFHNSVKSLNGVPFIYADMRYEDTKIDVEPVDYDYQQQPVSRYPMATYLFKNRAFFGSLEEISEIDPRLALKLEFDGVKWICLVSLEGGEEEIGFMGLVFFEEPNDKQKARIHTMLHAYANKLSVLLNK